MNGLRSDVKSGQDLRKIRFRTNRDLENLKREGVLLR